jgi:hypothetical protein
MAQPALKGKRKRGSSKPAMARSIGWRFVVVCIAILAVCLGAIGWAHFRSKTRKNAPSTAGSRTWSGPTNLDALLALAPAEIEKCDIAMMNLLCAEGLRGAEGLDVGGCLKTLDGWTEQVKWETQRHEYRFNEHRAEFNYSYGRYRMMMLGTVLAQDLGIHYTPGLVPPQLAGQTPTMGWSSNASDFFVHGLLGEKHEGTCASMPLLYVAIGRRLGYPVNLASSKYHLYVRYEEPNGGHFNVEATMTAGYLTPPDEDYKTGKFPCTDEEIRNYGWLRPMSNAEALSQFLDNRGTCLALARRYSQAKQAYLAAGRYRPDTPFMRDATQESLRALEIAPFGDRIDDLMADVKELKVPGGALFAYLENRKVQVRYFLNGNTNWPAMEKAVVDLKAELAEYQKNLTSGAVSNAPDITPEYQQVLEITSKRGGHLLLPSAGLPPPMNRGVIPPGFLDSVSHLDLRDEGAVWDTLWTYYKQVSPGWMGQAAELPIRHIGQSTQ